MDILFKNTTQSVDANGNIFEEPIFEISDSIPNTRQVTLSQLQQQASDLQAQIDKVNAQIDLLNNQPEQQASVAANLAASQKVVNDNPSA
jgi:peptidoglycan hydrolase CwlO-like protein